MKESVTPAHFVDRESSNSAFAHERFWRSVAEARGVDDATNASTSHWVSLRGRRDFMKLMGASLALAGAGCSRAPLEKIVPYREGPAQQTYGKPVFYASTLARDGYGLGVLVETNMGRPTKIEGNPEHPASLGATDVFAQAAVLDLWDPDRSQTVRDGRTPSTWNRFLATFDERLRMLERRNGQGLRILTGTVTSPSLAAQIGRVLMRFPEAQWHQWQPHHRDNVHAGAALAYGAQVDLQYQFDKARIVVALDGDFLDEHPGFVRNAMEFSAGRRADAPPTARNRLYALECTPTLTGANADHRLPLRADDIIVATRELAHALGVTRSAPKRSVLPPAWLQAIVRDLRETGPSIVTAGHRQPPFVHALVFAINERLGNIGKTLFLLAPIATHPMRHVDSLRELVEAMLGGQVDTLVMSDVNPAFTAPADFQFADTLRRVPFAVHHGLHVDETAGLCEWHIPQTHALETWGDLRSADGTLSMQQPCIAPLYGGKSALELFATIAGEPSLSARELFVAHWRGHHGSADLDAFLTQALRKGVVDESIAPPPARTHASDLDALVASAPDDASHVDESSVEIVFAIDPRVGDGRHANNAWLEELPKPLSQLTWDNAALIAPALAQRIGVSNDDVVEITLADRRVELPIFVMPGMPDRSITLPLGYGRRSAGAVGTSRGVDVYPLRTASAQWIARGALVVKTGRRQPLASAQTHHDMQRRDLIRTYTASQAATCSAAKCGTPGYRDAPTLYDSPPQGPYAWAMSIDLTACIGCGTCTIACQAENNLPVVGKDEVMNGREMHWIRVDRYYEGSLDNPGTAFQPVPCMQCEHAPCEVVCPVEASVHDSQGINVQVYNRCVGTRFCSNNCPYKVRRFNFFDYTSDAPGLAAQRNPEVTVRMRGVMEKCNYCLQRITTAKIDADREGRALTDGDVVTACQAACPTRAISFGDLNDPASAVNARKRSPLDYALLSELNTRPRTTYLARVVNPSSSLLDAGRSSSTSSKGSQRG
jgi:molybdopterin-containing oxidoreductase family iron-sulfur binding subunit